MCTGLDGTALEMYVGYMIQAKSSEIGPLMVSDVEVECMGPKRRGAGTVRLSSIGACHEVDLSCRPEQPVWMDHMDHRH
jgi:hypothetical protein